ncbi:MAG: ATP-dependent zinc protease [Crocinitomicaceae bacterium]|nr:ATP-dependent zinc protease [Crocinitomicaceae bacterium]
MPSVKKVIGRRELIHLPDLDSFFVEAKIDTGAFRTAVHCISCREIFRDGIPVLKTVFDLDGKGEKTFYFRSYRLRNIRNSFGQTEARYCIHSRLKIGRKEIFSDISLTDRSNMKYQVLIGRKTIGKKFLIDVSKIHLMSKPSK